MLCLVRDAAWRTQVDPAPVSPLTRAVAMVAVAALALASCTNYKSRLSAPEVVGSGDAGEAGGAAGAAGLVSPRPAKETRSVWSAEEITGRVRLRFNVSETGQVGHVEVLESTDERLEKQAANSLSSWPFEPGTREGEPVAVKGVEAVMVFYTDDSTTTGEVIGITLLVIVLLPIVVVLGLFADGNFKWGNN